jgi:putative transposase
MRGNNRRILFTRHDHEMFLFFVWHALQRTSCVLNAATLMRNHVHLLLTPGNEKDLSRFVKMVGQRYAQLRNQKRGASGKLYEERFFSKPVLNELQLAIVTAYIHANPVRAGIVDDALEYRWSTHALHAGDHLREERWTTLWTPSPWYESLADTPWQRAERYLVAYNEFLRLKAEPEHVTEVQIIEAGSTQRDYYLRRPNVSRAGENIAEYQPGSFRKIRA